MGVKKMKKTDLGDMVWVKYGITEYCAFLVTSNNPEHITDEETGALLVQVEWNGWSNTREWVFVHDILHKSSIESIGDRTGAATTGGGQIGRGLRAKRTPQEAMARKDEEMAAWLAVHSKQQQPAPSALKRAALKNAQNNEEKDDDEEEDTDDDDEEEADNFVDLCGSSCSSAEASCESSEEEEEDDDDDDESGYDDWDEEQATRQKPVLVPVQPYGLYDPRFEYIDESSSESDNDMDGGNADAADNEENEDGYESNDFLGSGSESEGEEEDEDAAGKRIIVEKTTEVFERNNGRNTPGGSIKLQTLVDLVHAELGANFRTQVDFYATVAQQMDFLKMMQQRRNRGVGRGDQGWALMEVNK